MSENDGFGSGGFPEILPQWDVLLANGSPGQILGKKSACRIATELVHGDIEPIPGGTQPAAPALLEFLSFAVGRQQRSVESSAGPQKPRQAFDRPANHGFAVFTTVAELEF